jgi:hypothetical protein
MEAAHRTALAKGEVGIREKKAAPTLKEFTTRVLDEIRKKSKDHPRTVEFYEAAFKRACSYGPSENA